MITAPSLVEQALDLGFSRARVLCPLPPFVPEGHTDQPYPEEARSALLVFLPYDRSEGEGVLAPFARSNYYREAVNRLRKIVSALVREEGLSRGELRLFCNSRFPEKAMAWHCGLGALGRNSLLITPEYGSLGIIAGLFLPFEWPGDAPLERAPYELCGPCRLCREACPGMAVREGGGIERGRCFQHLSTERTVLSPAVTGAWHILYGCQICQDVCPRNGKSPAGVGIERGYLGAEPDLEFILNAPEEDLRAYVKGTVLGQSWIEPDLLRRNALICLWNGSGPDMRRLLRDRFSAHPEPLLAQTVAVLESLS